MGYLIRTGTTRHLSRRPAETTAVSSGIFQSGPAQIRSERERSRPVKNVARDRPFGMPIPGSEFRLSDDPDARAPLRRLKSFPQQSFLSQAPSRYSSLQPTSRLSESEIAMSKFKTPWQTRFPRTAFGWTGIKAVSPP